MLFARVTKRPMLSEKKNVCDRYDPLNAKNPKAFSTETPSYSQAGKA